MKRIFFKRIFVDSAWLETSNVDDSLDFLSSFALPFNTRLRTLPIIENTFEQIISDIIYLESEYTVYYKKLFQTLKWAIKVVFADDWTLILKRNPYEWRSTAIDIVFLKYL